MKDFTAEIENSLELLLKLENEGSQKDLFGKEKNVILKITLFKIPRVHGVRKKYLKLYHSRFGSDPEICLFVPNRKSEIEYKISTDDSIDITVDYYTNFLAKHKVRGIKTIMPIKQLRCEYSLYELKRKLANRFDLFLCKTSLLYNPRFIESLGKTFIQKNKEPLGISFPPGNAPYDPTFNERVQRAIFSTFVRIKNFADNYAIPIGTLSNSKAELEDNLKLVLKQILEEDIIPGGFENIRSLYVGTCDSKAIPIYICQDFPEKLTTPFVQGRKERLKSVIGEISTCPGKKVIVKPNGEVIVMNQYSRKNTKNNRKQKVFDFKKAEIDDDNFNDDNDFIDDDKNDNHYDNLIDNDSDDDDVAYMKKKEKNEESEEEEEDADEDDEDEDEDDEEIEKRENRLLEESRRYKGEDEDKVDDDDDDDDDVDDDEFDNESEEEPEFEAPPKKLRKTEKPAAKDKNAKKSHPGKKLKTKKAGFQNRNKKQTT